MGRIFRGFGSSAECIGVFEDGCIYVGMYGGRKMVGRYHHDSIYDMNQEQLGYYNTDNGCIYVGKSYGKIIGEFVEGYVYEGQLKNEIVGVSENIIGAAALLLLLRDMYVSNSISTCLNHSSVKDIYNGTFAWDEKPGGYANGIPRSHRDGAARNVQELTADIRCLSESLLLGIDMIAINNFIFPMGMFGYAILLVALGIINIHSLSIFSKKEKDVANKKMAIQDMGQKYRRYLGDDASFKTMSMYWCDGILWLVGGPILLVVLLVTGHYVIVSIVMFFWLLMMGDVDAWVRIWAYKNRLYKDKKAKEMKLKVKGGYIYFSCVNSNCRKGIKTLSAPSEKRIECPYCKTKYIIGSDYADKMGIFDFYRGL